MIGRVKSALSKLAAVSAILTMTLETDVHAASAAETLLKSFARIFRNVKTLTREGSICNTTGSD